MNSKKTIAIWSRVLVQVCEGKTQAEQKKIILHLGQILKNKKKEYLLPKIIELTIKAVEKRGKLEITLAHEQPRELVEAIKKKLAKQFNDWEQVEVKTDPGLIGGFIAKNNQYILNASVKDYLLRLKRSYE